MNYTLLNLNILNLISLIYGSVQNECFRRIVNKIGIKCTPISKKADRDFTSYIIINKIVLIMQVFNIVR